MRTLLLIVLTTLLLSCAETGGAGCDAWRPLRFSDAAIDAMTPEEARAVLAHNLTGRQLCGW